MTTTLTITSGQASFTAQNYVILPSPGTAVPDNLVNAILQAASTAGVVLSSSAGTGTVIVPARRFVGTGTGAPTTGTWQLGDEYADATGAQFECTAAGTPGTWVTAQSGTTGSRASGLDMWVYGDSGALVPGFRCTPGREWPTVLARRLAVASMRSYAVGGSDAVETAGHIINGTTGITNGYAAVAGSKWDGTRKGIVFLHLGVNDFAGYTDRTATPVVPVATDAPHQNGEVGALRACLAVLSSASRVEFETGTLVGTWGTYTSGDQSNGSSRFNSNPGDSAAVTVTVPASGRVHVLLGTWPQGGASAAADATIQVDGSTVKTLTAATLTSRRVKTSNTPAYLNGTVYAVEVTATPGSHTVKVTHAGTAGQFISVDAVIVPSTTPPAIFVPQEYNPIVNGNQWNSTNLAVLAANRAILEPMYQAVVAEFPNAVWTPLPGVTDAGLSGFDGLHLNDRGMKQEADAWYDAVNKYLATSDLDGLYDTLATQTPTPPTTLQLSGTWTVASGTPSRVANRTVFYITGGTVTAISVDGAATGLTSGCVVVPAGHTIAVTYSVAPTFTSFFLD